MTDLAPLILGVSLDTGSGGLAGEWRAHWAALFAALDGAAEFAVLEDGFARPGADGPDAILLANWLAPRAPRIGLIAGAALNHVEPFHVSTAIATLDYVSEGRAGLHVQRLRGERGRRARRAAGAAPGFPDSDETALDRDALDARDVVARLWDSWEDGAAIRDVAAQRYLDASRLHRVDYRGAAFQVLGPSITPRPPQGRPPVTADWRPAEDPALALSADLVFAAPADLAAFRALDGADATLPGATVAFQDDLAATARDAIAQGARALRVQLSGSPGEAERFAREVAPALRAAGLVRAAQAGPLRERLGLPVARNRYAPAA